MSRVTQNYGDGGDAIYNITPILDEDDMVSNRDDALATQQSIKAYVDTEVSPWLLPPAEDTYDPTGGLPVGPSVGDRYISDATANGWTEDYVYEWDGSSWVETVPEEGEMIWMLLALVHWVFFSGGWMEVGSGSFLALDGSNADSNIDISTYDLITTGAVGRDTDNEINWGTDNSLAIAINGATSNIVSVSTGAGDNDKLVTQGYVNDQITATTTVTTVNVATYDLLTTDDFLHVTYTSTAAVTSLTLPTAQTTAGRCITIKDAGGNASANNITVDTEGAETIDGAATAVISGNYDSISLYSNGVGWFIH